MATPGYAIPRGGGGDLNPVGPIAPLIGEILVGRCGVVGGVGDELVDDGRGRGLWGRTGWRAHTAG